MNVSAGGKDLSLPTYNESLDDPFPSERSDNAPLYELPESSPEMAPEKTKVKWFDKLPQHEQTLYLNFISQFHDIIDEFTMRKIRKSRFKLNKTQAIELNEIYKRKCIKERERKVRRPAPIDTSPSNVMGYSEEDPKRHPSKPEEIVYTEPPETLHMIRQESGGPRTKHKIAADGDCLFNAIAHEMNLDLEPEDLRRSTWLYLLELKDNGTEEQKTIIESQIDARGLKRIKKEILTPGEWTNESLDIVPYIISNMLSIDIHVYNTFGILVKNESTLLGHPSHICLIYNGSHYDATTPMSNKKSNENNWKNKKPSRTSSSKARVPEPGDIIIIKKPFRSDDRAQILFKEGMNCTIEKVDENCNIFVSHPSWSKHGGHWIKSTKFKRITLKNKTASQKRKSRRQQRREPSSERSDSESSVTLESLGYVPGIYECSLRRSRSIICYKKNKRGKNVRTAIIDGGETVQFVDFEVQNGNQVWGTVSHDTDKNLHGSSVQVMDVETGGIYFNRIDD